MGEQTLSKENHTKDLLILNPRVSVFNNSAETILYLAVSETYFRISDSAKLLIFILQEKSCTMENLIHQFCRQKRINKDNTYHQLEQFIYEMIEQGFIIYEGRENEAIISKTITKKRKRPTLKIGTTKIDKLFNFVTPKVKEVQTSTLIILGLLSLMLLTVNVYTYSKYMFLFQEPAYQGFSFIAKAIPFALFHLLIHELSHSYTCKKLGGFTREAGVGLLYYVLPVAYVDLTDMYRLPNKSRAIISLAGPLFDVLGLTVSSLIVISQHGTIQAVAFYVMTYQLFMLAINTNLLLPSDLYRFIESLSKDTNLRKHSFDLMRSIILGKDKPVYLKSITSKRELIYISYSIISTLYIIIFVGIIIIVYITQVSNLLTG